MATIETAALSDPGRLRGDRPNEDTCYASAPDAHDGGTLLVVADGVGGMPGGREASTCAVEVLRSALFAGDPPDALSAAFAAADAAVRALRSSEVWLSGAGTTLVAAYLRAGHVWLANVGDSRGYLVRDHRVTAITHDHSYVQTLGDAGELPPAATRTHPLRNVITRVVGDADSVPNIFALDLSPGDLLILCSDGLWGPVSEDRLAGLVRGDTVGSRWRRWRRRLSRPRTLAAAQTMCQWRWRAWARSEPLSIGPADTRHLASTWRAPLGRALSNIMSRIVSAGATGGRDYAF